MEQLTSYCIKISGNTSITTCYKRKYSLIICRQNCYQTSLKAFQRNSKNHKRQWWRYINSDNNQQNIKCPSTRKCLELPIFSQTSWRRGYCLIDICYCVVVIIRKEELLYKSHTLKSPQHLHTTKKNVFQISITNATYQTLKQEGSKQWNC